MIPSDPRRKILGHILGPRGLTLQQMEAETGCRIVIRGKGSVKVNFVLHSDVCKYELSNTASNNTELTELIAHFRIKSERSRCVTVLDGSTLKNLYIY